MKRSTGCFRVSPLGFGSHRTFSTKQTEGHLSQPQQFFRKGQLFSTVSNHPRCSRSQAVCPTRSCQIGRLYYSFPVLFEPASWTPPDGAVKCLVERSQSPKRSIWAARLAVRSCRMYNKRLEGKSFLPYAYRASYPLNPVAMYTTKNAILVGPSPCRLRN